MLLLEDFNTSNFGIEEKELFFESKSLDISVLNGILEERLSKLKGLDKQELEGLEKNHEKCESEIKTLEGDPNKENELKVKQDELKVIDGKISLYTERIAAIDKAKQELGAYNDELKTYDETTKKVIAARDLYLKSKKKLSSLIKNRSAFLDEEDYLTQGVKAELDILTAALKESKTANDNFIYKKFEIDSIAIEINEGFIENILVVGKVKERDRYEQSKQIVSATSNVIYQTRILKFENLYPIGFSRKIDFEVLKDVELYTRGGTGPQYVLKLEDVLLAYIQKHKVDRRDYSPANQIVEFTFEEKQAEYFQALKREPTYKLFELQVFSDFIGFNQETPNGLIQSQVSKRINLLTERIPMRAPNKSTFFGVADVLDKWNFGCLTYIKPTVTLSKLEDNNKHLLLSQLDSFTNNNFTPVKYTSTLELRRYENFSVGLDMNLFLLDMPNFKSTFYVDYGFRYGHTATRDSITTFQNNAVVRTGFVNDTLVNTFRFYPTVTWEIKADERFQFRSSWTHNWFWARSNAFSQVANIETTASTRRFDPRRQKFRYNTIRLEGTFKPNEDNRGRLFFRYTYNWQQGFWRTGFHQAQVGYSLYLLGRYK